MYERGLLWSEWCTALYSLQTAECIMNIISSSRNVVLKQVLISALQLVLSLIPTQTSVVLFVLTRNHNPVHLFCTDSQDRGSWSQKSVCPDKVIAMWMNPFQWIVLVFDLITALSVGGDQQQKSMIFMCLMYYRSKASNIIHATTRL